MNMHHSELPTRKPCTVIRNWRFQAYEKRRLTFVLFLLIRSTNYEANRPTPTPHIKFVNEIFHSIDCHSTEFKTWRAHVLCVGESTLHVRETTVLWKSNGSEFRQSSTKFYVNVRNFEGKFAEGGKISFEISLVRAKFRSKFRKWEGNFKRNFQHFVCVSEISTENLVW